MSAFDNDTTIFLSMLPLGADEELLLDAKIIKHTSELVPLLEKGIVKRVELPTQSRSPEEIPSHSPADMSPPNIAYQLISALPEEAAIKKLEFHERICSSYANQCEAARKSWLGAGHGQASGWLGRAEANIWACFDFASTHSFAPNSNSQHMPYPHSIGKLVYAFSTVLRMTGRSQDALKAINSVLQTSLKYSCLSGVALCRLCLSKSYAEAQNVSQSLEELVQCLALFVWVNDETRYADSLLMLSRMYSIFHCSPKDLIKIWGNHQSSSTQPDSNASQPSNSSIFSSTSQAFSDMTLNVEQLLNKGIKIAQRTNEPILQADMYLALGRVVWDTQGFSEKDRVLGMYSEAMKLFEQAGDLFGQAESLKSLALMEWPTEKNTKYKTQASEESQPSDSTNRVRQRKASLSQDNDDFLLKHKIIVCQRVSRHLQTALLLYSQCRVPVSKANTLRMLAALEFEIAQCHAPASPVGTASLTRAFEYVNDAKTIFQSLSRSHGEAACLKLLGEMQDYQICTQKPSFPLSLEIRGSAPVQLLEKALNGFGDVTPQAQRMRIRTCIKIANILGRNGNSREEAFHRITQAEELCSRLAPNDQQEFLQLIDESKQQLIAVGARM
eukprot:c12365_g1_i1.p1 GENE.c12365_g1_i1~~c12365_g1_i1.p1  ORF type:complete len:614 (+),score=99.28 c12365_g1_i1:98-1939(+)